MINILKMPFTCKSDELEFPNYIFDVNILTSKANNDLVCVCFFKKNFLN